MDWSAGGGAIKGNIAIVSGFSENLECGAVESSAGCARVSLPVSCGQLCLHLARSALPTSGEGLDLGGLCKDLGFYPEKDGRAVILRVLKGLLLSPSGEQTSGTRAVAGRSGRRMQQPCRHDDQA